MLEFEERKVRCAVIIIRVRVSHIRDKSLDVVPLSPVRTFKVRPTMVTFYSCSDWSKALQITLLSD